MACATWHSPRNGLGVRRFARVTFQLDAKAIAAARASDVLALHAGALGSTLALRAEAPPSYGSVAAVSGSRVACVEVLGPLAQRGDTLCGFFDGYDTVAARLSAALGDSNVDAVVLVIDSNGGDAAGMSEGVRAMRGAVAASGKPVIAYVDELAASAAYALATVAPTIIVPATGRVGSIGTASIHVEESRALDAAGVTATVLRSSPNKYAPNGIEKLTDEGRARLQSRVDAMAQDFAALVVEARGGTAAKWLGLDAALFTGADAVAVGLADGVATLEQTKAMAAAAAQENRRMSIESDIGKAALALTGATDSESAIKKIGEWQAGATRAAALEAKLSAREAEDEQKAKAADEAERIKIVEGMVAAKTLMPANAWASSDDKGPHRDNGLHPRLAAMKTKHLRAMAASVEPNPALAAHRPDPTALAAAKKDATVEKAAKDHGVKPETLAATRALNLSGTGSAEV